MKDSETYTLSLTPRSCEACGTSTHRKICEWSHTAITRSKRWLFRNTIAICERCGFTFLTPCFKPEELTAYYNDSFARFAGQSLDFDPEKRLAFIEHVLKKQNVVEVRGVIELGGNAATTFQASLRVRYGDVASYEPNAECGSDFDDVKQTPSSSFDLLLHYFILEHIAEVRPFLRECRRMLRPGGIMVVEVPDLLIYPQDIAALILHEHCNHFSVENLRHLAAQEGFRLIDSSNAMCSRSFGFASAFERLPDGETDPYEAAVFERNLTALKAGVQRVEAFRSRLASTLAELRANPGQKTVLWGANDNLNKFLADAESLPNAVLVDSDPRKAGYHPAISAILPEAAVPALQSADRLILFTRLHAPSILSWIADHCGRQFKNVVILDY